VAEYRLYTLDELGRISLPEPIIADGDRQALAKARGLLSQAKVSELWKDNRLVATLDNAANANSASRSHGFRAEAGGQGKGPPQWDGPSVFKTRKSG